LQLPPVAGLSERSATRRTGLELSISWLSVREAVEFFAAIRHALMTLYTTRWDSGACGPALADMEVPHLEFH